MKNLLNFCNVPLISVTLVILAIFIKCLPSVKAFFRMRRILKCLKGPKQLPLVGNVLDFFNKSTYELFHLFLNWHTVYGDIFTVSLGPEFGVFLKNPQDVEVILSNIKHIDKSREYSYVESWLGTGLLTSTGSKWSARRKLITPTFHFNILKEFIQGFAEHSRVLVQKLDKVADGTDLDIMPYICSYTLDVICETAMGVNLNSQNDPDIPYVKAIKITSELFVKRFASLIGRFNFTYKLLSPDYKISQKAINEMHTFTNAVITQRRAVLRESGAASFTSIASDTGIKRKLAFLDMLLLATIDGRPLSDEDIREEVDTFMFEGHDTTAVVLAFALMLLSRHDDVQQRLYEELIAVLDEMDGITFDQLNELKYLECVIKESLRLYPSVPLIGRTLREDVRLTNNILLPSGVLVFVSIFSMHRDGKNFADAETFNPDRFADVSSRKSTNFDYVPFSAGPRNCIGQKFAMLEMKYVLATIVSKFELLPTNHSVKITGELVLRALNGITLRIKRRK